MRRAAVGLLLLALGFPVPAAAQIEACASSTLAASARFYAARAGCVATGMRAGREPDAGCAAKALEKLEKAFVKAKSKGPCGSEFAPAAELVDTAVDFGIAELVTRELVCCAAPDGMCTSRLSEAECSDAGGTPGAEGSVCQGDGTCGAPTARIGGPCCQGLEGIAPGLEGNCVTGIPATGFCAEHDRDLFDDAWCEPTVGCVNASEPPRTRCTSAEVKAFGKYVAGLFQCDAKALKQGTPFSDAACYGKAESKLDQALEKARRKGDCLGVSNGEEAFVGRLIADGVVDHLYPDTQACCVLAEGCFYATSADECTSLGGQPGSGECGGAGTCVTPPAAGGACCAGVDLGTRERCVAGTTPEACESFGGGFVSEARCLMSQTCFE